MKPSVLRSPHLSDPWGCQGGQSHPQSPLRKKIIRQNNLLYLQHSRCTFDGGLLRLDEADEAAADWLTYGS